MVVKITIGRVRVLELNEKAVSKKQQRFFGMVRAAQKGEGAASPEVAKVAGEISKKDAKDFAKTKHKGLPEKKEVSEARANAVIARRILQNKKKCADCGSYAHVTGASNCPSKKDPEGLPEGASIVKEGKLDNVMNIVRKYGKKKPEKKAEKAMDAGAKAKRKLARKAHAKYVSGSEDNVPDDIRDHKEFNT